MKKLLFLSTLILAIVGLIALIVFFLKGAPKNDIYVTHDAVVHQIEELGNLEVVKYNIQDIIEYRKMRRWLPNSKTSLQVSADVIACIDLTKIRKDDIYTNKDSVSLILPMPEICNYKIDHSRSRVFNIDYGFWETAELVDEAYQEAERHVYQEAIRMGIAEESRKNTIKVLTPILKGLGFTKINIGFRNFAQEIERQEIKITH